MPRARSLKPGFFKDEKLVDCGPQAMLLFAGLWTLADRDGRLEDRPRFIKGEVFPYTAVNVEKLLSALDEHKFITRYESDGKRFISIRTWKKHQNPHVKEPASSIPAPGLSRADAGRGSDKPDAKTPLPSFPSDTLIPLTSNPARPPSPILEGDFLEFRKLAESRGVLNSGSEEDWKWARHSWLALDSEQRVKAYIDVTTRPTESPEMRSLPQNYLKEKKFTRPMPKQATKPMNEFQRRLKDA